MFWSASRDPTLDSTFFDLTIFFELIIIAFMPITTCLINFHYTSIVNIIQIFRGLIMSGFRSGPMRLITKPSNNGASFFSEISNLLNRNDFS